MLLQLKQSPSCWFLNGSAREITLFTTTEKDNFYHLNHIVSVGQYDILFKVIPIIVISMQLFQLYLIILNVKVLTVKVLCHYYLIVNELQ